MKITLLISLLFISISLKAEEKIILAGGCFWCIEAPFYKTPGVISAKSGYIHGHVKNPTYKQVSSGKTGHIEAVEVIFDEKKIILPQILSIFWQSFDPTDKGGSFHDRGSQYTSGVFYFNEKQKKIAEATKTYLSTLKVFNKPVITPIHKATKFYYAEDYHQDYHKKNPLRYKYYRYGSGRDKYIEKTWNDKKLVFPMSIFK